MFKLQPLAIIDQLKKNAMHIQVIVIKFEGEKIRFFWSEKNESMHMLGPTVMLNYLYIWKNRLQLRFINKSN